MRIKIKLSKDIIDELVKIGTNQNNEYVIEVQGDTLKAIKKGDSRG